MELEGSLKAFSLPEILQFLSIGKMTGTLSVTSPRRTINLMIRSGRIVNSSSFQTGRKLGSMLLHHNLVRRRDLDEALRRQREDNSKRLLGQLLVEEGYITEKNLHDHIAMQLQEEVWDLFRLTEGDFKFEHGQPEPIRDIEIEIDIEPLIIEGSRQLDEWHRIIKNIPGDHFIVRLAKVDDNFEPIPLTDEEWKVLSYINGKLTIGAIVAKSTVGKFETYNNLNTFLSAGMIELREQATTSGEAEEGDPDEFVIPGAGVPIRLEEGKREAERTMNLINRFFADIPEENAKIKGKYYFMTPVGQLAHFVNSYIDKLWNHPDFVPGPEDGVLVERRWNQLINENFRADCVEVTNNRVNAMPLEKFVGYFGGVAPAARGAYEDTLQALTELAEHVIGFAKERIGRRAALAMRDELRQDFAARALYKVPDPDFDLAKALAAAD
jgi:hypothetical protein